MHEIPSDGVEWRANELQRRIENRRQAQVFASPHSSLSSPSSLSSISTKGPRSVSLPQLLSAKHDAHEIRMQLFDVSATNDASLRSCEQQFTIEKNLRQLQSGLSATQLSIQRRKDTLGAMEMRITRMAHALRDTSDERNFAKQKLEALDSIRQQASAPAKCCHCSKLMLPSLLAGHEANCEILRTKEELPKLVSNQTQVDPAVSVRSLPPVELPRFVSQPPRSLRVAPNGIKHNSVVLMWDPPIFTGSNPILDYELKFSIVKARPKHNSRPQTPELELIAPQLLTRWCLQVPVAANQFRLTDLTADQEYGDFTLCAITRNGKGHLSNRIELVHTAPAVAPTKPLFLTVGLVTSSTISLSWIAPHDDGGTSIQDYEISFREAVHEENVARLGNFLDVNEVVFKERRIRTYSAIPAFVLRGLLSGQEHQHFRVRAVNATGIPGEDSDAIETILTIAPGSEFRLLDELQAAVNARARVVDSQFLSGFMQRYDRQHYITLVSTFILDLHPNLEDKVAAIVSRNTEALANLDSEKDDSAETMLERILPKRFDDLPPEEQVAERRRQFHFRISELTEKLKKAEYNVQWCHDRRIDLVALIRATETRILEKQAELERARTFSGAQMDSDVLEQGRQRFYTKELVFALEDEIEIEQLYILDTKAELVQVENYLHGDEKRRATLLERLQQRRDALAVFERVPDAYSRAHQPANTMVRRLVDGTLHRTFMALVVNREECRAIRQKLRTACDRFLTHRMRIAFKQWRTYLLPNSCGVGSAGLIVAASGRDELICQSHELLQLLRKTDTHLTDLRWTHEQKQPRNGSKENESNEADSSGIVVKTTSDQAIRDWLVEADTHLHIGEYDRAVECYANVMNNAAWSQALSDFQRFKPLLHMGQAHFHLQQYDQALMLFTRASLVAPRLRCSRSEGQAYVELAHVHFAQRSLHSSLDHYERAFTCFEAAADAEGQLQCYRGLELVYEALEDREMLQNSKDQADRIEFTIANNIRGANATLQQLKQRLVGVGAEPGCVITLERVGAIVPRLRKDRILLMLSIREEQKRVAGLQTLLADKVALLALGETDLKRALASDSTQVDSSVLTGCQARFEMEDFKAKLTKLMGRVKVGEQHVQREIQNVDIRIRNAQDEIRELEAELQVETGALMRQMLAKERVRCFRFNATNAALKNVVGTASHGISTCVGTAGLNALLFDLLTGACLAQGVGDPLKQHLGDPTGHQAPIVSLYYVGERIYTGTMDACLGVWSINDARIGGFTCSLLRMLTDFDAAVMSVTADNEWIACGSADCDVFVYSAVNFALMVRIIGAHARTVTAIALQSSHMTFTTGAGDHQLKVWQVGPPQATTPRRSVQLLHKLGDVPSSHEHPLTCVAQTSDEIVSGDVGGRIVIWNLGANKKLMRTCNVHPGIAITCVQFDATRIVSGAANGKLFVTDFATGQLLQTLYGHQSSILDLQFDRTRMMSASEDGAVRLWFWQTQGTANTRKKYHILGPGETMRSLSLKYRSSTADLLRWNGIPDSSKLYLGQKLIVAIESNDAAEELQTLDRTVSVVFGKASYENLDFVASHKSKSKDVDAQLSAHKMAMLAKEYFPDEDDNKPATKKPTEDGHEKEEEEDDEEEEDIAIDDEEQEAEEAEGDEENESAEAGHAETEQTTQ